MKFLKKIDPEDIKLNYSSGQDINLVLPNSIVDLHSFTLYYDYQYDCQNLGVDGTAGYNNLWRSLPSLSSCIVDELRIIIDGKEVSYIQEYAYLDSLLHDINNDNCVYNNTTNSSTGYRIESTTTTDTLTLVKRTNVTGGSILAAGRPNNENCSINKWLGFLGQGNRYFDARNKKVEIKIKLSPVHILYNAKSIGSSVASGNTSDLNNYVIQNIYATIKICDYDPEKLGDQFDFVDYKLQKGARCVKNKKTTVSTRLKNPVFWAAGTFISHNRTPIKGAELQRSNIDWHVLEDVNQFSQYLLDSSVYFDRKGRGIQTTSFDVNNYPITPLMNNLMALQETKNVFNSPYNRAISPAHFQHNFYVNAVDIDMADDELKVINWNVNIDEKYVNSMGTPFLYVCYKNKV